MARTIREVVPRTSTSPMVTDPELVAWRTGDAAVYSTVSLTLTTSRRAR